MDPVSKVVFNTLVIEIKVTNIKKISQRKKRVSVCFRFYRFPLVLRDSGYFEFTRFVNFRDVWSSQGNYYLQAVQNKCQHVKLRDISSNKCCRKVLSILYNRVASGHQRNPTAFLQYTNNDENLLPNSEKSHETLVPISRAHQTIRPSGHQTIRPSDHQIIENRQAILYNK